MTKLNTELERLVAVETKLDIVIDQQKKLVDKFDELVTSYVHRNEYEETTRQLEKKIEDTKRKNAFQTWITGTLSAILGAILAILIKAYFGI